MSAQDISSCANGTTAYQPRVEPWEQRPAHPRVLKGRRIPWHHQPAPEPCGVPSERIRFSFPVPGLRPGLVCNAPLGQSMPLLCRA